METPTSPPRCLACGKRIFATRQEAIEVSLSVRLHEGHYQDEYRCPRDPLGGWHLRDLLKRYEKVRDQAGPEAVELLQKIKRLDLLTAQTESRAAKRALRGRSLETALRSLPHQPKKPVGRGRTFQRPQRHHREDGASRAGGTRGTAVNNELRRRAERARLREELRREEKD